MELICSANFEYPSQALDAFPCFTKNLALGTPGRYWIDYQGPLTGTALELDVLSGRWVIVAQSRRSDVGPSCFNTSKIAELRGPEHFEACELEGDPFLHLRCILDAYSGCIDPATVACDEVPGWAL